MGQEGEPYMVYLAAKDGKVGELKALLQNKLTEARLLECQKGQDTPRCCIAADYLEHVDVKTGFTPLLAAVFWHRAQAARLLLHHGADVHNHGVEGGQRPLCLAVRDLNMDNKLIELLVSYGASPFLEAKDGMTPLDKVIQLKQNRIGPMPYALGSALLCLRRRCAVHGHFEFKVDRYMLLGQIWQKFYCVLTPREKIPGCVSDTQLLVFSKNGSDPVTSIMMTKAAAIEIPAKVAHDRACFELVLSCCQPKKPSKLFSSGSPRDGYSIYVRSLSNDPVGAQQLHNFVNLCIGAK